MIENRLFITTEPILACLITYVYPSIRQLSEPALPLYGNEQRRVNAYPWVVPSIPLTYKTVFLILPPRKKKFLSKLSYYAYAGGI